MSISVDKVADMTATLEKCVNEKVTKLTERLAEADINNQQKTEKIFGQLKQIAGEILMLRQAAVANNLKAGKVKNKNASFFSIHHYELI